VVTASRQKIEEAVKDAPPMTDIASSRTEPAAGM